MTKYGVHFMRYEGTKKVADYTTYYECYAQAMIDYSLSTKLTKVLLQMDSEHTNPYMVMELIEVIDGETRVIKGTTINKEKKQDDNN